jgi:hypothetical protein
MGYVLGQKETRMANEEQLALLKEGVEGWISGEESIQKYCQTSAGRI